jgi:D-serine deaminase-like pyridoxal phosphate-dependent protein
MISYTDTSWSDVSKPTLIIRPELAKANIAKMLEKAHKNKVRFRPHFKTHQSAHVSDWFRDVGVTAITVSSVSMAQYFADAGWTDITISFPVNIRELEMINKLAKRITLNLIVENPETVQILGQRLEVPIHIWMKTDTGYKRSGVQWDDTRALLALATKIKEQRQLDFMGLLTHAGHSYKEPGRENSLRIYEETRSRLTTAKVNLEQAGISTQLSLGDTPSCSVAEDFTGIDEIRPGNFVFYDLQQLMIGSCQAENLALAVACPVVAKNPERGTVIVYGGAVHFSKDFAEVDGTRKFGIVAQGDSTQGNGNTWLFQQEAYLAAVSQEHGTVKLPLEMLGQLHIGDLLLIVPAHVCLTVDLIRDYRTPAGERFRAWS